MSNDTHYRGIFYSIEQSDAGRWRWEIKPPTCIRELHPQSGEVEGQQSDAVIAVQKAIDRQTGQYLH